MKINYQLQKKCKEKNVNSLYAKVYGITCVFFSHVSIFLLILLYIKALRKQQVQHMTFNYYIFFTNICQVKYYLIGTNIQMIHSINNIIEVLYYL